MRLTGFQHLTEEFFFLFSFSANKKKAHPLNLAEAAAPLRPFLHKLAAAGRRTAREWYGVGDDDDDGGGGSDGGVSDGDVSDGDGSDGDGRSRLFGGGPWVAHG